MIIISTISSCGDSGIVEVVTTQERYAQDIILINEYIKERGYTDVDTTSNGVRFLVTSEGDGDTIESGDIVSLHYTGRLIDDYVFITSIDTTAINNDFYDSTRSYSPSVFTHSETGWALSTFGFSSGFVSGISNALPKIKVGGSARLIIPSTVSNNGSRPYQSVPANSILVFDIYPVNVRKD